MSADRDVTRIVRSWLHEDAREDADRVLNLVLDELDATPQRRAGWLARRFPAMNNNIVRIALVAAVVVAAVIIGANLLPRPSVGPSPSVEPSPTPSPTPSVTGITGQPRLDLLPTGNLAAGTYEIDAAFPVRLTLTLPDGFGHGRGVAEDVGIHDPTSPAHGIEFQVAANVYPDPCHWQQGAASPPVGPTVDDLVVAMTSLVDFQAGPVEDVTIGGLPAKAFDLTNEIDPANCDGQDIETFVFAGGGGGSSVASAERQRIYVMQVGTTRLMIMTYYIAGGNATAEADAAAVMQAIVDSIAIPQT
jgi:hypothetical protein